MSGLICDPQPSPYGQCHYCKRALKDPKRRAKLSATRDHLIPKCKGGRHTVKCCRHCNQLKADMEPHRWLEAMREFPKWWKQFHTNSELVAAMKEPAFAPGDASGATR